MAHIVVDDTGMNRIFSTELIFAFNGGVDLITIGIGIFTVLFNHCHTNHFRQIRRGKINFRGVITGFDRLITRFIILGAGNVILFQHPRQHHITAGQGAGFGIKRVKGGWCLRQPGDHRNLAECQLIKAFAEIDISRSPHAVSALAEVNFVQIQLENFIFGQHLFDADGQERFLYFTDNGFFRAQEEVTGKLLCDGTGAL